ncbi:MAG: Fe-S protein assembly co-chaperone HscB [Phycisphaerae bacterium]|nr:Fe-S protein assembly co-chaperone HscB [Phycisphaerae bacterium]
MPDNQTFPAKCGQCAKLMSTPVVCDFCHSLQSLPNAADHFTLLGLPREFDIDEAVLREKFFTLNRHAHPDFHGQESGEVQELSLRLSSQINDAYRALRDPFTRAAHLLALLGGKPSAVDKSVPAGFLGTMMMLQEELSDAHAGGDQAELARLRDVLQTQHAGLMNRIGQLFADHQNAVACHAVATHILDELRKQLNAVSYVKKLLTQAAATSH